MPRKAAGWWDERRGKWFARVGPPDPGTGRRSQRVLKYPDGTPVKAGDKKGAREAVARELAEPPATMPAGPTVMDVCKAYLAWQYEQGAAQRTIDDHHARLTKWANLIYQGRPIGTLPASEVGPPHLWAFDSRKDRRHVYLSVLACWRWAARPIKGRAPASYLPSNPLGGMQRPKAGRRDVYADWPTARRIGRLAWRWSRARPKYRGEASRDNRHRMTVALLLTIWCGARPSEVIGLGWDEIDWELGVIAVHPDRDKRRRRGEAHRVGRWVAVPRQLLAMLARIRRDHPDAPFPTRTANGFGRWWNRDLRRGLDGLGFKLPDGLTLYGLRHGRIHRRVILEEVPAEQAAVEFGTSAKAIRDHYLHPSARDAVRISGVRRPQRTTACHPRPDPERPGPSGNNA